MKILRDKVTQAAYVSDGEIMDEYSKMYIKANAKYIQASANDYQPADATITPAEIEKYYTAHIDEMPLKKNSAVLTMFFSVLNLQLKIQTWFSTKSAKH